MGGTLVSRTISFVWAVFLAASCVGASAVQADLVTYTFTGELTLVDPGIASEFSVGEIVTGTYTFETTTPDSDPLPTFGEYNNAITAFSANIGGDYPLSGGTSNDIKIRNNDPIDAYSLNVFNPTSALVNGLGLELFSISLGDSNATLFDSDALPTTVPDLSQLESNVTFNVTFFTVGGSAPLETLEFELTSLEQIPEPSSVALALLTLSSVAVAIRRRK